MTLITFKAKALEFKGALKRVKRGQVKEDLLVCLLILLGIFLHFNIPTHVVANTIFIPYI